MSFNLKCSSPIEAPTNPFLSGKRGQLSNAFVKAVKLHEFRRHVPDGGARRRVVAMSSSHLVPEGVQDMSKIKQHWSHVTDNKVDYVRTLLVDNYDSYTFNVYQQLSVINNVPPFVVRNDEWTWEQAYHYLYVERAFDNIVISPGPGSPACSTDIGICLRLLIECTDIPILGVCLGHQALGYAHGAQIVHAEQPIHGRLSEIEHDGSRLFHNIPSGRNSGFKVVRYHSLEIDEKTLPEELVPTAWTSSSDTLSFFESPCSIPDSYTSDRAQQMAMMSPPAHLRGSNGSSLFPLQGNGLGKRVIMGIKHVSRPHYGLQFHPESVGTCYGKQLFKNFRDITVDYWQGRTTTSSHRKFNACLQASLHPHSSLTSTQADPISKFAFSNLPKILPRSIEGQHLKLRWKRLASLANKVGGARNIFCELFGDCKAEETFWLDSSSTEKGRARFSFMGSKGGSLWKQITFKLSDERNGGQMSTSDAQGNSRDTYLENGFLDFLDKELQTIHCSKVDYEGLPFDFCGGYIGYIGYNLKVECGAANNRHKSSAPDACFFFVDNFLAIDHHNGDVYVMSVHDKNSTKTPWLDDVLQKLLSLQGSPSEVSEEHQLWRSVPSPSKADFSFDKSRDQYIQDVDKCLEYIKDGESYELCLTTKMRKSIGELDPLDLYLRLREQNPAPYAAWLNFPKEDMCICSSSPERFLRLDRDGILEAKPIKGTISRGSTPEKDEQQKLQLQHSEKDQAENLMIVDLLRNDLGQVCDPGSVHVPKLMDVETYATVHTMVSTIRGKKREHVSPVDSVRAAFPGGSMTGAPKLRSMEILDSLENCSRGVYSGSIGYFSINNTFDLNIVIRTVVIQGGEASVGAGGAIIALSNPEAEYDEMILKTRAPSRAIVACQTESQFIKN